MKILITGFPGTGKTSVAHELSRRGHNAYDPEAMRGYMHLQSVGTGRNIHKPDHPPRGWYDTVASYNWDLPRVAKLIEGHEDVFICSLADNMEALLPSFDKVFVLVLDDLLLKQRIRKRNSKGPGNDPSQLADVLMLHRHFEASMTEAGAIPINVESGVSEVVARILNLSYDN